MPNPNDYSDKSKFMSACISKAKKEGKDQDQAVAMCNSMWENKDSDETTTNKDKFAIFSQDRRDKIKY